MSLILGKTDFKSPLAKILAKLGLAKENPHYNTAKKILEEYAQNSLEHLKLSQDRSLYFSKSGKAFLSYKIYDRHAIVFGDPVGPYQEIERLIKSFQLACKSKNITLGFLQTTPSFQDIYIKLNFDLSIIGNEGFVALNDFELSDPNKAKLREQIKIVDSYRYRIRYYKNPNEKQVLQQLRNIYQESAAKEAFNEDYLRESIIMTIEDMANNIIAFTNIMPSYIKNNLALDLIYASKNAPEGSLEYLLTYTILFFKELAYKRLSLGLISNARTSNKLQAVKAKFIDILEPRYFARIGINEACTSI